MLDNADLQRAMLKPPLIMSGREQDIVNDTLQEFAQLQTWRNTFASHWEEVAELIWPTQRNTFMFGNFNWPGEKKTDKQIDATGMLALERFGAILDSLLTPFGQQWHQLTVADEEFKGNRAVKLWMEKVTKILFAHRYAPNANFIGQVINNYMALGAFGTTGMYIDDFHDANGNGWGIRYRAIPTGEMFYRENDQGLVDGFCRWFRLTARQLYQKFGIDCLPPNVITMLKDRAETPFDVIHRVVPRDDYDPSRMDQRGKPYASYYVFSGGTFGANSGGGNAHLLREGGYRKLPIAVSRYTQQPGEVYGRSPAMAVLPALKTLNAEKRTFLKQGHRIVDPVLLTADDGIVDLSLRPGAINKGAVNAEGRPLIQALQTGNLAMSEKMMDKEISLINDMFLITLFQIMTETPQMTATEVIERVNEKGILIAPIVGRQQSEFLGPIIDRELDILAWQGLLPPMPPILKKKGGRYSFQLTSPLAKAMRSQSTSGFTRILEGVVIPIVNATQDPSLLDEYDFPTIVRDISDSQSLPESWMATDDQKKQKAQARAQAQQQRNAILAAPAQAAIIKAKAVAAKAGQGQPQQQAQPQQGQQPQEQDAGQMPMGANQQ